MSPSKALVAFVTLAMLGAPMLLEGCFERDKAPAATGSTCPEGMGETPVSMMCAIRDSEGAANTSEEASRATIYTNATVRYDDAIPLAAHACISGPSGNPSCADYSAEAAYRYHAIGAGNYTHAHLTLSWTSTSPANGALWIALVNMTKDANGAEQPNPLGLRASGTSPVTIEGDIPPNDEKNPILILIVPRVEGVNAAYARKTLDQPFHVEGSITKAETQPEQT